MMTVITDDDAKKFGDLLNRCSESPAFNGMPLPRLKELMFHLFSGDKESGTADLNDEQFSVMDYLFDTCEEDTSITDLKSLLAHYDGLADRTMRKLKEKGLL